MYSKLADDNESLLYQALRDLGLSKQAATGPIARAVTDAFISDEAVRMKAINARLCDIENTLDGRGKEIDVILESFQRLAEVSGELQSEKAKDALILWHEMLRVSAEFGVPMVDSAKSISFIMYAVFGGQARRIQIKDGADLYDGL